MMSHAVTSLPLPQATMSLPSHTLHKSLEPASASKPALTCLQRAQNHPLVASWPKSRSALLNFKRTAEREIIQKLGVSAPFRLKAITANLSGLVDDNSTEAFDYSLNGSQEVLSAVVSMAPVMKRGYGAFGGATLEKSKLDLSQSTSKVAPQTADGGGGGDIGKKNSHGGGDGGDDGGDDDDYFGDFDDGDEGDEGGFFRKRGVFEEIFDRRIVEAVLQEWYRTMSDLPAGLLQAFEMGLISSAQMVRYLSMNARPTVARFISRALPSSLSRAFIGRMIADPAFLYKMFLEQATTICCSVWWELRHRKERIKQEWDLALLNVLTVSVCNAAIVWSLAPCRSYGNTFHFNLQNTLQKLPNNIFERSYPLREFDMQKRIHSFFYKAAELCMVGMVAGAAHGSLSKLAGSKKEGRTSVLMPSVSTSALSHGAFIGLSGNLRYQLLYGMERIMQDHFDVLGVVVFLSTAVRVLNIQLGDVTRLAWLGLDVDPMFQSENMLKAYSRPSQASDKSTSNWFIAKKAIISGLFGGKQESKENIQEESRPSKAPRKRIVKRKVTASS
eukprot:Gb_39150 [translate_table: standard]